MKRFALALTLFVAGWLAVAQLAADTGATPLARTAAAAANTAPDQVDEEGWRPDPRRAAIRALQRQYPAVRVRRAGDDVTQVYGRAFGEGDSPQDTVDGFLANHTALLGVSADALVPGGSMTLRDGRFTVFFFRQQTSGRPVYDRWLKLLVRNEPDHPLVLANSTITPVPDSAAVQPTLEAAEAVDQARALFPDLSRFGSADLVYHAPRGQTPVLAWRFFGEGGSAADLERLELFIDAVTGALVDARPGLYHTDITGQVDGKRSPPPFPDQSNNPPQTLGVPGAHVFIPNSSDTTFADHTGAFTLTHSGTSSVTVKADLQGEWSLISNKGSGGLVSASAVVTPPGPITYTLNPSPSENLTSQVNAFVATTIIHDAIKDWAPTLTALDFAMPTNVNLDNNCNAYYTTGSASINFFTSGGGCPNTAYHSVVHHEYGHGVTDKVPGGPDDGDYHEGMADVLATLYENDPCVGHDFSGQNSGCLRNVDTQNLSYPCSGSSHTCGLVIGGAFWDLRTELIATEGLTDGLKLARELYIDQEILGNHAIDPSVTVDLLTLDDDDSNILNGTPHYDEIDTGFALHGLPAPALVGLQFSYPQGRPALVTPDMTTTFPVSVTANAGQPISGTGTLSYRIGITGTFTAISMTETSPNVYDIDLPAAACKETIEYYVSAGATEHGPTADPLEAPTKTHEAVAALSETVLVSYTFESDPGWTISNTTGLSDGAWDRGVPVDDNRGDPPSDYDGSGQCWLTDNVAGNSDVDDGATTLTSQVIDLTTLSDPFVSYARWFSNTEGNAPEQDVMTVEVSHDSGTTWTVLETVGPTLTSTHPEVDGGWFEKTYRIADVITPTSGFQIRFTAEDASPGSIVEAGVDAFRVFDYNCPPPIDPGDCNADTKVQAADLSAIVLELFDGDGSDAGNAGGGTYPGDPVGCDANEDTVIDAADLSCTILLIFDSNASC